MNSVLSLFFAIIFWGLIHSVMASLFVKDMIRGMVGKSMMRGYRLFYNLFAGITFLPILYLTATLPNQLLYEIPAPWSYLMLGGQAASVVFLFAAFTATDPLSFIGLSQLFEEKEKTSRLVTKGLYRRVRHPLYTFSLLFIWLNPSLSLNSLILYIGVTCYVLIGIYFEERKLLREFGSSYADYCRVTPMLIPHLTRYTSTQKDT